VIDPILRVSLEVQPFARAIVGGASREVAFLRIDDEVTGRVGFGECAPLPGLHREDLDEALAAIEDWMDGLRAVPSAEIPAGQGFFIKKASDSTFSTWTLPAE
jgi:L-alanine-DL-glutamate epimerase-like enolase superfamily enzyme